MKPIQPLRPLDKAEWGWKRSSVLDNGLAGQYNVYRSAGAVGNAKHVRFGDTKE